eukprot:CAMPEP_0113989514 /NCGR_PEP_ID=MMETSP0328-20130328/8073_1 /TAXON_ID=39455 /ORGANISM="Alexandrium minutum" /LENGTH=30 /assembly_acc=CAM_ASM_000350
MSGSKRLKGIRHHESRARCQSPLLSYEQVM